jgi:tRNA dimethylallyltransferase
MPERLQIPVVILFGPTGSGKTELLETLFASQSGKAEIVSADAMQVYRGMDIGTAKPHVSLRSVLPHHLIDIRDPGEQFNAGDFVHLADQHCAAIAERGALPIISGGTGFYLKVFIHGLPQTPPGDLGMRQKLKEELRLRGITPLMNELAVHDPESAGRIHPNDSYRILRALEVIRASGRPLSSFPASGGEPSDERPEYRFFIIGLNRDREDLYQRIDERCARMFRAGLPEEVRGLFESGYTPKDPGLRGIGYKEFFEETEQGDYRLRKDEEGIRALIARNTRRYAKRQRTFFASIPGAVWLPASPKPAPQITDFLKTRGFL